MKMSWDRIAPYIDHALDLEPAERETWIAELTTAQPEIAEAIRKMLARHARLDSQGFLAQPLQSRVTREVTGEVARVGMQVGAYTIERLLGRGGMGDVWLASRSDGRYDGKCAIKFLSVYAAQGPAAERFRREGQLLARLEHPNIARLLDAGTSDDGVPFLALEYVEGVSIDRYCESHSLDIKARLRLFQAVLAAVSHAQDHLVVHRDIKPSNILVTRGGVVKLLDFGVARLLEDSDVSLAMLTRESAAGLTPAYAAPEQLTNGPISAATDVYSLGVLLFVLTSGKHPAGEHLNSPGAMVKAILETDAPRLSEVTDRADKDLETIIAKSLKKRPSERYGSANAFADDIRRYLDHQPISARQDTFAYRAAKFVRRNRLAVAASVTVLLAIVGGAGTAVWQARVARAEAQRAENINAFILSLFEAARPGGGGGADLRVVELLTQSLPRIERELGGQVAQQLELYVSVGNGLSELNAYREAIMAFDKAHALAQRESLLNSTAAIEAQLGKASSLIGLNDLDAAAQVLQAVGEDLRNDQRKLLIAKYWLVRSYLELNEKKPTAAVASATTAVNLVASQLGREHKEYLSALRELVRAQYHADDCLHALPNIDYALQQLPHTLGTDQHPEITLMRGVQARCLRDLDRNDDAVIAFEKNDAGMRAAFGPTSKDYAIELLEHGGAERTRGNSLEAIALITKAIDILKLDKSQLPLRVTAQYALLLAQLQARRLSDAQVGAREFQTLALTVYGADERWPAIANYYVLLVDGLYGASEQAIPQLDHLLRQTRISKDAYRDRLQVELSWLRSLYGDQKGALRELDECIPKLEARGAPGSMALAAAHVRYGQAHLELGQFERAVDLLEAARVEHLKQYSVANPERADILLGLARGYLQMNQLDKARALADAADDFWSKHEAQSRWAGEAAYWKARVQLAENHPIEARDSFARAIDVLKSSGLAADTALAADARKRLIDGHR